MPNSAACRALPTPTRGRGESTDHSGRVGVADATFTYDGDGVRVKRADALGTTVYVGNYYELSGSTTMTYYYAGGQRVALRENSTLYFLLGDHLGSTAITANSSGGLHAELRYKPWGENRYTSGATPTTFRFTGQRSEETTLGSLYFYQARFYSPAIGRFLSADTIVPEPGNPQDLNRYTYVRNNPLRYNDPSGHYVQCIATGLGALVCAAITWVVSNVVVPGVLAIGGALAVDAAIHAPPVGPSPFDAPLPVPPPDPGLPLKVAAAGLTAAAMAAADAVAGAAEETESENADDTDSTEGTYEFPDAQNPGRIYVGQSGDVPERLEQWRRQGRLAPGTIPTTKPVPGGKTAREAEEQRRINELGGTKMFQAHKPRTFVTPLVPDDKRRLNGSTVRLIDAVVDRE